MPNSAAGPGRLTPDEGERLLRRFILCLFLPLFLAACAAEPVWAPDDVVKKAIVHTGNPPSVTLLTVIGTSTGAGGHSALMIDG